MNHPLLGKKRRNQRELRELAATQPKRLSNTRLREPTPYQLRELSTKPTTLPGGQANHHQLLQLPSTLLTEQANHKPATTPA